MRREKRSNAEHTMGVRMSVSTREGHRYGCLVEEPLRKSNLVSNVAERHATHQTLDARDSAEKNRA